MEVTAGRGPAFLRLPPPPPPPRARPGDGAGSLGGAAGRGARGESGPGPKELGSSLGRGDRVQPRLPRGRRAAETPRLAPPRLGHTRTPGPVPGSPPGGRGDPRSGQRHGAAVPRPGEGIPAPGGRKRPGWAGLLGGEWSLTSELPRGGEERRRGREGAELRLGEGRGSPAGGGRGGAGTREPPAAASRPVRLGLAGCDAS